MPWLLCSATFHVIPPALVHKELHRSLKIVPNIFWAHFSMPEEQDLKNLHADSQRII